jgi:hypothetical protein
MTTTGIDENVGQRAKRVDPAELIFFRGLTSERFFEEAKQLQIPLESLRDPTARDHVFRCCLTGLRTETVKAVAAGLDIAVSDQQAAAIAHNSLVPEVFPEPAPLTPEERLIAEELYVHAIKAATLRNGSTMTDKAIRSNAKQMVRAGERGISRFRRLIGIDGWLALVAIASLGSPL